MINNAFIAFGSAGGADILSLILGAIVIHAIFSVIADRFFPDML